MNRCQSIYVKNKTRKDSTSSRIQEKKRGSRINIPENIFPPYAVKRSCNPKSLGSTRLFRNLTGQQVALDSEHLAGGRRNEAVDLARELLHLAGVEHALQPAGLGGELEQTLPLVLGEQGLLQSSASGVLLGALLLPVVDLLLLTAEHTLVVLVIVDLGIVGLDAVQQKVAVLLQERIDAEGQVVKVRDEDGGLREGAGLKGTERGREIGRSRRMGGLELVDEGGDQMRVVNLNRQLFENVLVAEIGFLQPVWFISIQILPLFIFIKMTHTPLS